ncbi:alpha/beta hydrolase family protein [Basilea psittacipulmonis]|uniref:Phospholipase/carboxylesterase/thioesterase domain-containing protein n=1 Tax=Basilea psittacipulmonis DSM 24701 TaxID=1072685 RepID=A0A077DD87_9BURK|nr:hypothetical protein [Basilea psittacipulmonis]AIL32800.1 hypothetical protein IX83_05265 [Basilea psittacipulmonis DSM 24701]
MNRIFTQHILVPNHQSAQQLLVLFMDPNLPIESINLLLQKLTQHFPFAAIALIQARWTDEEKQITQEKEMRSLISKYSESLVDYIKKLQEHFHIASDATALISSGLASSICLDLIAEKKLLPGRFIGLMPLLVNYPQHISAQTTLHLFYNQDNPFISLPRIHADTQHLKEIDTDFTYDIFEHPYPFNDEILESMIKRILNTIPLRIIREVHKSQSKDDKTWS